MGLWTVALLVFLLNLPFGYWRASVRRRSSQWFLALLVPVLLVIALIIFLGLGWKLITFPVLVGAFFLGQFVGGRVRNIIQGRGPGRMHH
jgi:integral membrane sensor domain MASE1